MSKPNSLSIDSLLVMKLKRAAPPVASTYPASRGEPAKIEVTPEGVIRRMT